MKATIDIPEALYRRVKSKSALEGRKIRDVTIELYERWLSESSDADEQPGPSAGELLRDVCGMFDSGVGDLSTNPKYMEGFGRDSMGNR